VPITEHDPLVDLRCLSGRIPFHRMAHEPLPLGAGSQIRCPHCQHWHPLIKPYADGTDYTRAMLFFECRGGRYYAAQEGGPSRHETKMD